MLDPVSILALVSTANSAYSTLKQGSTNASELLSGMGKFFQAKQRIDKQAEADEKAGKVDSEAFGARIELIRKEKELEEFITYECEGWVKAEWERFKAQARKVDDGPTKAQRQAKRKQMKKDDDIMLAIKVVVVLIGLIGATLLMLGSKIKEFFVR